MKRNSAPVLISLSSFGRSLALEQGQAALAEIAALAGADGVMPMPLGRSISLVICQLFLGLMVQA